MEIVIQGSDASEYLHDTGELRWAAATSRQLLGPIVLLVSGLIFTIVGAFLEYTIQTSSSTFSNGKSTMKNVTFQSITRYDYHISLGLGIGLVLVSLYSVYILKIQRRRFDAAITEISRRHKKYSNNFIIKLNDTDVLYQDYEKTLKHKWTVFSHYRLFKGNILFFENDFFISTLAIEKKRISDKDFNELVAFLKNRLPSKK